MLELTKGPTGGTMKTLLAVLLLAAACAAPLAALDPGEMQCISDTGVPNTFPIAAASAYGGGILYSANSTQYLTTADCIVNLGPGQCAGAPAGWRVALICSPAVAGYWTYDNIAFALSLSEGVWTWREDVTGDCYLATTACSAGPSFLP